MEWLRDRCGIRHRIELEALSRRSELRAFGHRDRARGSRRPRKVAGVTESAASSRQRPAPAATS